MATAELKFTPAAMAPLESNVPAFEILSGTNVKAPVAAFDDTTEEYLNFALKVPGDVDTSGTVSFRAFVTPKTAAASKNCALTFGHSAIDHDEDFDAAYTDEDSGDKALIATQDDLNEITWTETVSNLGWAAHDLVFCRFSRPAAGANNLVGDLYFFALVVAIPLT